MRYCPGVDFGTRNIGSDTGLILGEIQPLDKAFLTHSVRIGICLLGIRYGGRGSGRLAPSLTGMRIGIIPGREGMASGSWKTSRNSAAKLSTVGSAFFDAAGRTLSEDKADNARTGPYWFLYRARETMPPSSMTISCPSPSEPR